MDFESWSRLGVPSMLYLDHFLCEFSMSRMVQLPRQYSHLKWFKKCKFNVMYSEKTACRTHLLHDEGGIEWRHHSHKRTALRRECSSARTTHTSLYLVVTHYVGDGCELTKPSTLPNTEQEQQEKQQQSPQNTPRQQQREEEKDKARLLS